MELFSLQRWSRRLPVDDPKGNVLDLGDGWKPANNVIAMVRFRI